MTSRETTLLHPSNVSDKARSIRCAAGHADLLVILVTSSSRLGRVANHFDVVPIRSDDESCVVICVVVRTQARLAIVPATRLEGRAMEGFDLLPVLGRESKVKMRRLLLGLEDDQ